MHLSCFLTVKYDQLPQVPDIKLLPSWWTQTENQDKLSLLEVAFDRHFVTTVREVIVIPLFKEHHGCRVWTLITPVAWATMVLVPSSKGWLVAFAMLTFSFTCAKQVLYYWAASQSFSFNVLHGNWYSSKMALNLFCISGRTWTYNPPIPTSWVAYSPARTYDNKEPWVHKYSIKMVTLKKQKLWDYAYVSVSLA